MTILELILTSVLGGGVITFILGIITVKYKKKQEQNITINGEVDLTEAMLKKYQQSAFDHMEQIEKMMSKFEEERKNTSRQETETIVSTLDKLSNDVQSVRDDVNDIVEYLNGDFREYRRNKK